MRSLLLQGGATDPPRITSRGVALLRMRIVDLRLIGFSGARGNTPPLAKLPTSTADCQEPKDQGRKHWRQDRHQPCQPRPNPKKSKSPLVIPCKFSAVTYSEGLSGTRSVARYALRICAEINDLQSARMSGAECQRGGMPSVKPRPVVRVLHSLDHPLLLRRHLCRRAIAVVCDYPGREVLSSRCFNMRGIKGFTGNPPITFEILRQSPSPSTANFSQ